LTSPPIGDKENRGLAEIKVTRTKEEKGERKEELKVQYFYMCMRCGDKHKHLGKGNDQLRADDLAGLVVALFKRC